MDALAEGAPLQQETEEIVSVVVQPVKVMRPQLLDCNTGQRTMASIEITGIDQLMRKLNNMQDVNEVLRPPMQRAVFRLQRDMANYPPQRAGSSYVRTGTLGRRWTTKVERSGDGLTGKIGNNTVYGPFVQSRQFQASVHRGRWQTDVDVVQRNRARIVADFEQAIQRALDE